MTVLPRSSSSSYRQINHRMVIVHVTVCRLSFDKGMFKVNLWVSFPTVKNRFNLFKADKSLNFRKYAAPTA